MDSDELLSKYFEADECAPEQKVEKYSAWLIALENASKRSGLPADRVKRIVLLNYARYRAKRLSKELPHLPRNIREE